MQEEALKKSLESMIENYMTAAETDNNKAEKKGINFRGIIISIKNMEVYHG